MKPMLILSAAAVLLMGGAAHANTLDLSGGERLILAQDAGGGGGAGGDHSFRQGQPAPNRSGIAGAAGGGGGGGVSGEPLDQPVSNQPYRDGGVAGPFVPLPAPGADVTTGGPLVAPAPGIAPQTEERVIVVPR